MTDYFGGQTTYSYDASGRLTSLANPFGEVTTFQYDANSRLIKKTLPNGTYTTYTYNSRGFLAGIANYKSNGTLITYANYTYDAVGNRLSMTTPEGTYSYTYDAIYRLTGEQNPISGSYTYTYDAVGNRLSMTHNGQTTNYTYDAGNKLLQAGSTTFTYDGNGNMVSKTENGQTTTYVYNYEDKMVQVILPNNTTITYTYDHEGKRIGKTANGTTIDYYFDGNDLIIEAQGASIIAYYTQGQGLISQRRNNLSYFYHYDGLGSTKSLTDSNQNAQASYKYDAWGNVLQTSGTITNPYLYVGELGYYGDGDAGMYLLTQRWYNSLAGRFSVRDLVRGNSQAYIYLADNPSNFVDPEGSSFVLVSAKTKSDKPWWYGCLCDLNIFKIARCVGYALGLFSEWQRLIKKYGYYDRFVHCVVSCDLALECGEDFSSCIGQARERAQGRRADPEDIKANNAGIDCAKQKKNCTSCCIDEKGYPPFRNRPRHAPKHAMHFSYLY